MAKEMLINVSAGEECRIALLENNKLEELYMERTSNTSHVGNIYKGKVTNVEPSIQAAFVDFGIGRNGFLHISDLMPTYFGGKKGEKNGPAEKVGQKLGRRDRPPIQQCLRKGDEIVVQIIKEGIGTKGPTLSTYLSIPGRVLVMMPGMAKMGVSKKIEDEEERARLRKILDGLTPPKDCGFIIRTAGIGKTKLEIEKDLKYLARLWEQLKKAIDKDKPPVELYTEGDLVTRTVRDVFTSDVEKITVDDKDTAKKIKDFIKLAMPRTKNKVELYTDVVPLFHKYELEEVVEGMYSRRVPLPSGGSLIIDQTEAVVAIDVNSGKFRDHSDAETTAFKTDLEAADEIPRQLRLRDMGGVIICDFIDLRFERHRRELEERLFKNLAKDRAKTRMLRMSQFGIIEMTRQRMRPSLRKAIYHDCEACGGQGMVKTPESMALDVMRKIRIGLNDAAVVRLTLTVNPDVALYLQNRKRYEIAKLEQDTDKRVTVAIDSDMSMDQMKFELYDSRDGYIYIAELGMELPSSHHNSQRRDDNRRGRDRDRDRRPENSKPKHDKREDDSLDSDELFNEESESKPAAKAGPKGRGSSKKAATEENAEVLEQTGNDDEASVVDVDEGGDALPGSAPGTFFDPNERDRRGGGQDRNRGRGRGRDRDRPRRGGRDRDDRGGRPDRQPAAERPVSDELPESAEVAEVAEDTELDTDEAGGEARDRHDNGGERAEGEQGHREGEPRDGDQREGGRRRRRRRGRRGRGRSGEGEGGEPHPQQAGGQGGGQGSGQGAGQGGNPGGGQGRSQNGPNRPQQGGGYRGNQQNNRRGGSPADLSHLAREASRKDASDHAEEDDGSGPGNDINFVPRPAKEPAGRNRGGRRGARGGRTGGRQPAASRRAAPIEGLPDDEELDREAAELEARLAKAREVEALPPKDHVTATKPITRAEVAPTGSSDKHLADDVAADGEDVAPPSSYSDLDALPDYDDE